MTRSIRISSILEPVWQRIAGLKLIHAAPDYLPTLRVSDYETDINGFTSKLDGYNQKLAEIDEAHALCSLIEEY